MDTDLPGRPDADPPPRTPAGEDLKVVVFDVNETLSDFSSLGRRFEEAGAPARLRAEWFAGVLRDGFALTAAGAYADFGDVARDGLRSLFSGLDGWEGDVEAAAGHVLDGLAELTVHPDVPGGVRLLREAGFRLVTMTNGAPGLTGLLLSRAGIRDEFDALLGVGGPRCWKPAPQAYRYAVDAAGVRPGEAVLAAVHPWDVDGGQRAGLSGAWLRRGERFYPQVMSRPTLVAEDLEELARTLAAHSGD